jgi:hypothetical protein
VIDFNTQQEAYSNWSKASNSLSIPTDEQTLTDMQAARTNAKISGLQRALDRGIGKSCADLAIRDIQPQVDIPTAFAASARWIFPAPAGAVAVNTLTNWINEAVPNNRIIAFYGIAMETALNEISQITFRQGPGGNGRTIAVFNVESCYTKLRAELFFGLPVVYEDQENMFIQVYNRIAVAAAGVRLILRGLVVERANTSVSRS